MRKIFDKVCVFFYAAFILVAILFSVLFSKED